MYHLFDPFILQFRYSILMVIHVISFARIALGHERLIEGVGI